MELKNKIALVTGAGSGIGKELSLALLDEGSKVIAIDLRPESLEELKTIVENDHLTTHCLDITDRKAIEHLASQIESIDILINNAGIIQPFKKIKDLEYEAMWKVMDVNYYGTLYMTKTFLPILLEKSESYLVNVSSMGGFLPVPGQSIYGASKAAVKLFTEGLYAELLDTNVHVAVVFPGATATNISSNSGIKMSVEKENSNFKTLPAKEASHRILNGMKNNKVQIYLGQDCTSMNLFYRISPVQAIRLIANKMKSLLD